LKNLECLPPSPTQDEPPAPISPQVVEEVMPPENDPRPLAAAAPEIPSPEALAPAPLETWVPPVPAPIIEANALTPVKIAAHNLEVWLAKRGAGTPTHPVRLGGNSRRKKWENPPAIDNWQRASTTDEKQIKAWCRDLPAKLGILAHHLVAGIWCGHPALRLI